MKNCINFGTQLEDGHIFCPECGQAVELDNLSKNYQSASNIKNESVINKKRPKIKLFWGLNHKNFKSMLLKEKIKFIIASLVFWPFIFLVLLIILMSIFSDDYKEGYQEGKNINKSAEVIESDNSLTGLSFSYTLDTLIKNYNKNIENNTYDDLNSNNEYQIVLDKLKLDISDFQEETSDVNGCRKFSWRSNNDSVLLTVEEDSKGNIFYVQSTINTNQPDDIINGALAASKWFLAAASSKSVDEVSEIYEDILNEMADLNLTDKSVNIDKNIFFGVFIESNCLRLNIYTSETKVE